MDKNRLEGCRLMEESSSRGEATFYGGARGGETAALEMQWRNFRCPLDEHPWATCTHFFLAHF
jgi:hypothetical protein